MTVMVISLGQPSLYVSIVKSLSQIYIPYMSLSHQFVGSVGLVVFMCEPSGKKRPNLIECLRGNEFNHGVCLFRN